MHVLLAVDGSASSLVARDLVGSRPWPEGTSITVLTAYDTPGAVGAVARQRAEAALALVAEPLEGRGWSVATLPAFGPPAWTILATADGLHADLIVLGSRGRGPIPSMLLGSVSARVAASAPGSVLVARRPAVSRLIVATDGSECSAAIPRLLAGTPGLRGVPALAVSVAPVGSPDYELVMGLFEAGSGVMPGDAEMAAHRAFADRMASELREVGIEAVSEPRRGDVAHEILTAAHEHGCDLIVTGATCRRGAGRAFGTVARNVLVHAAASVLIARGGAS